MVRTDFRSSVETAVVNSNGHLLIGLRMAQLLMWAAWLALLVRLVSAVLLAFLASVVWTALQSFLDRVRPRKTTE